MEKFALYPKPRKKGKKPVRVRKPSRPLDGINHRLIRENAAKQPQIAPDDDAPPTRDEMEAKATELGLKFDGRTSDRKLSLIITEAIEGV